MKILAFYAKKFSSLLAVLVIVTFLFVAFFGMADSSFGMQMNEKGQMSGCLFGGHAGICTMTQSEHIQAWQNLFTTLPPKAIGLSLVLLLFGLTFVSALIRRQRSVDRDESTIKLRNYSENLSIKPFNFIQEALSQGILNPKIF